jgi:ribosomal-protein-alanine N-acetyltransferase
MNFVTHAMGRRSGIAKGLLAYAHKVFRTEGVGASYLELRRSNYSAYRLYKKNGYVYVGIRKDYYPDNMEDAILMRKMLG